MASVLQVVVVPLELKFYMSGVAEPVGLKSTIKLKVRPLPATG